MIIIKTDKEIAIIREGGKILGSILKKLLVQVKPGITTGYLEQMACDLIKKAGGRPSFKGYKSMPDTKAFPTALCTSINSEIVHEYPFNKGQRGYYTDMSATAPVGRVSKEAKKLIRVTKKSLMLAIKEIKPGCTLNDIGQAIQTEAEAHGDSRQ